MIDMYIRFLLYVAKHTVKSIQIINLSFCKFDAFFIKKSFVFLFFRVKFLYIL